MNDQGGAGLTRMPSWLHSNRAQRLAEISKVEIWDMIIVGGGIIGAGVLRLAAQQGWKVLMLEQRDFAWGSSSRSSKMVHGGLRYIAQGQYQLTKESVRERQRLLQEFSGLIYPQSFVMSHYQKQFPWPWIFNSLLYIYDLFSGQKQHQYWSQGAYQFLVPGVEHRKAIGGTEFVDAITDDARLVYRLIQEAQSAGAQAINYVKVNKLLTENNHVIGVQAQAEGSDQVLSIKSHLVINATGAWAKQLVADDAPVKQHKFTAKNIHQVNFRPLRGSHVIVASWRLPVACAISVLHPKDKRPVQIFPWQNVTVIGTTDVEHHHRLAREPSISQEEMDYLLAAVALQFPAAKLTSADIISTFAGVRPIVVQDQSAGKTPLLAKDSANVDPSKEKRDHFIWQAPGIITIAGGKLTTFQMIAEQVMKRLPSELTLTNKKINKIKKLTISAICNPPQENNKQLSNRLFLTLQNRYGALVTAFINQAKSGELLPISYSAFVWAELAWSAQYEQVLHLDDLLLRRTRLGNVLPLGGIGYIEQIKLTCGKYLGWTEDQWQTEIVRYQKIWTQHYSLPNKFSYDDC